MKALIFEYDPEWKTQFEEIKRILNEHLSHNILKIEHVGSTSIVGMASKPIIDIDIIYQSKDFKKIKSLLESVGYLHHGDQGILGREVFKRNTTESGDALDKIAHHLYVCEAQSDELQNHLLFRNHLRQNKIPKNFYQELKYNIAAEANNDRKQYAALKELKASAFIKYIIELEKTKSNANHKS